jgi:hypothetical protein
MSVTAERDGIKHSLSRPAPHPAAPWFGADPTSYLESLHLWLCKKEPQALAFGFTGFAHRVTVISRTAILRARRLGL